MAKKFRGVELVKEVRKALDEGQAQFVTNTQSKLSKSSPVDSGRLASSWFVGKGSPNRDTPPKAGTPAKRKTITGVSSKIEGTNRPEISITRYQGKVTFDGDWWLSSNLPYSARAALDPGYVGRRGSGAGDWFSRIQNNLQKDAERIFQRALKKIK